MILLYIIVGFLANMLLGCFMLCITDFDQRLFEWVHAAPYGWCKTLVIQLWPFGVYMNLRRYYGTRT